MKSLRIIKMQPGRITDCDVIERNLNGEKGLYEILLKRYNLAASSLFILRQVDYVYAQL